MIGDGIAFCHFQYEPGCFTRIIIEEGPMTNGNGFSKMTESPVIPAFDFFRINMVSSDRDS